jgi:hypothetical protein
MKKVICINKSIIGTALFIALTQNVSAQSIPGQLAFKLGKFEAYLNPETVATSTPQSVEFSAKGGLTFQLPTPYNNIERIRILFFSENVIHRAPTYDAPTKTLTYFRKSDEYNSYLEIIRIGTNVMIKASTDPIESLLITASN